jgi:hypothetical protein
MAREIFINYRFDALKGTGHRLVMSLEAEFGADAIGRPTVSLRPRPHVTPPPDPLASCRVMLVMIGPRGVDARDHHDIATALRSDGVHVICVLIDGAPFPRASGFPGELMALSRKPVIQLSDDEWEAGVGKLVGTIRSLLNEPASRGDPLAALMRDAQTVDSTTVRRATPTMPATQNAPRTHDVFISYSGRDQEWADAVVEALERGGCKCWIASRAHDIPPGTPSYARAITKAIKASRIVVVIVSEHSSASDDVLNEITIAKNSKVPRLPLRVDASALDDGFEYFFSQSQHLNVAGLSRAKALDALVASVSRSIR